MVNLNSHNNNSRTTIGSTIGGFTLVETLVAAIILVIVIIAAVTAMRKGVELEVSDNHRREARTLAHWTFEKEYDYRQYSAIAVGSDTTFDTLDRTGVSPLLATVVRSVSIDSQAMSGTMIPLRKVTVSVRWQERGNDNSGNPIRDTITIHKWLAEVK